MSATSLPLTHLIHECLATVLCFCLSREKADEMVETTFQGEWKYLRKVIYDRAEQQATKAVLELALFMRVLDDNENFSRREWKEIDCGCIFMRDRTVLDASSRQAANKIIHAERYEWKSGDVKQLGIGPVLVCYGRSAEKWERAEIEIFAMAATCGQLIS